MLPISSRYAGFVPALVGCALVAGCAGTPSGVQQELAAEQAAPLDDPQALIEIGDRALERGQYVEAARAYRQAAEASDDERLAEEATRVAFEHGQTQEMYRAASRWLELNATSEEARRYAAFGALRLYRIDVAADHFEKLLDSVFINPQAGFLALLPQWLEEESRTAVTATLRQLAERYPDLGEAHYALAQAALRSDNFALALTSAERAAELSPYWSPAGMLLARVQLSTGEVDAGIATAERVVERDPQPGNRLELALIELAAGREESGREALDRLAEDEDLAASVERTRALLALQAGDVEAAAEHFESLLRQGRFVYEALFQLGAIAESRGDEADAFALYSRVIGGDYAVAAQSRAARIKRDTESLEAALAHLGQFADTRPNYRIEMIAAQAALLDESGNSEGALEVLDQAIGSYPDSLTLRLQKSFLLERLGRTRAAVEVLEALYEERPQDPVVTNALGYTLVDGTREYKRGQELIEAALAESPDSGAILDSMGWALYKLRRYDEALEYLEQARERISDPEVELHIGEVLWALGRRDEAIDTWRAAAERYPSDRDLQQRLERAESGRR
ncbi:MAG TPA: tetratricopeptide repeat protein [Steroidobacteraceae bacterium]|nr:tetratricopeptide repeat protein [Steroidobacteraceae bacterium]